MRSILIFSIVLGGLLTSCGHECENCGDQTNPFSTPTPSSSPCPLPSAAPGPTSTPKPTVTPCPTPTPRPSPTPCPTPKSKCKATEIKVCHKSCHNKCHKSCKSHKENCYYLPGPIKCERN